MVWSTPSPLHQLWVKPLKLMPVAGSVGNRPVGSMRSLPPTLARTFFAMSASQPYNIDASHQWLFRLAYAGGRVEPAGAGSGSVRETVIVPSLQSSPCASGMSIVWVLDPLGR